MFSNQRYEDAAVLWTEPQGKTPAYRRFCLLSVFVAFTVGLIIGVFVPIAYLSDNERAIVRPNSTHPEKLISSIFLDNSHSARTDDFTQVSFVETDGLVEDGIFWGERIEKALPTGFTEADSDTWNEYVNGAVAVRLERGCGRMQNRLVTFRDGARGCARYRQNLDQIQGELFSFYLARLLRLPNVAPSAASIVDGSDAAWKDLPSSDVSSAQWASNRPVVVTEFVSDLAPAGIPVSFRPPDARLSRRELLQRNSTSVAEHVELAQWSDLVVFDYLTANLDRVVNNLYNRQWNANIMDAPAHNLARRRRDGLLVFLDNESGLLHGYRLLHKYEPYHALLLDNLCVFRRSTADAVAKLRSERNVGTLLSEMFERDANAKVRDVLPPLPPKSVKILNDRIDRIHSQIERCRREHGS